MACRSEHDLFGFVVGAVTACVKASPTNGSEFAITVLAGGLVGRASSAGPDCIEPAVHPNHRRFAHSWAVASGLLAFVAKTSPAPERPFEERLVGALAPSAAAGYCSHLALDACTSKGLPLL